MVCFGDTECEYSSCKSHEYAERLSLLLFLFCRHTKEASRKPSTTRPRKAYRSKSFRQTFTRYGKPVGGDLRRMRQPRMQGVYKFDPRTSTSLDHDYDFASWLLQNLKMTTEVPHNPYSTEYWYSEKFNPSISLGRVSFPAYVLLVSACLAFFLTNGPRRLLRNEHAAQVRKQQPPPIKTARLPAQLSALVDILYIAYTCAIIWKDIQNYHTAVVSICYTQSLSLGLAGCYVGEGTVVPCLATALGWILLPPPDHRPSTIALTLTGMLLVPCKHNQTYTTEFFERKSAIVLAVMALDFLQRTTTGPLPHDFGNFDFSGISASTVACCCLVLGICVKVYHDRPTPPPETEMDQVPATTANGLMDNQLHMIVSFVTFLGPMAIVTNLMGFFASCIGWRWLLLHKPASTANLTQLSTFLGSLAFIVPWGLTTFIKGLRSLRPSNWNGLYAVFRIEMLYCMDLSGLMSSLLIGLWLLVVAYRASTSPNCFLSSSVDEMVLVCPS